MTIATRFITLLGKNTRLFSMSSKQRGKVVPFNLSDIGEGIKEVTVKEWFVKPGDKVAQFDNICEVQSDKASVTITSRYDGHIKNLYYQIDDTALVGKPLLDIELQDEDSTTTANSEAVDGDEETARKVSTSFHQSSENKRSKVLTTPAVRRLAMENNIDLTTVPSTGKDGRILKEDVLNFLNKDKPDVGNIRTDSKPYDVTKSTSSQEEIIPLQGYQKHMWKTMTQSLRIPHFVYSDECDVTKLIEFRSKGKEFLTHSGIPLSFLPFFIKATSKALEKYPRLNALLDEESQTLKIIKSHNISLAMDTPQGLIVPNIKNIQNLSITEIAKELHRLQKLGEKPSFAPSDLAEGTIALSNIGSIGGTYAKPVILSPQILIGAIGKIQKLPRFDGKGEIVGASVVNVSWAADHRVVDGATVARFSNTWKHYIENPIHLLL
ncbi:lipoamide acyltransferase component of branched-chain alpha-keto acid dehydrogenase complex, mitochondrial [Chelonus insularis]|uniref:lipoamide acyltransferase component of branched-chain alpha-keto acid dehydrogenase complex, mitochondrial n=1 Tax=Chelonus insularis TaxID=460826 RepID=UPI001588F9F0|nr:lipoamide acyltransferase component of branched-chain alpha-keto acid dehydrogenase complex, mitochondrial [Chelonus insularis]XP_034943694.1 lipoamide acyltransferase component of branched-chain alpha-keto acid dehydrogenase complex, mitochondrial [Chelonus insularis]